VQHVLELIGQAIALFISTDLDDVFVLLGFFADPKFRIRQIVAGQFLGIAILYAVSVAGSWVSLLIPPVIVGLLGLVPIAMGLKNLWELRSYSNENEPLLTELRTSSVGGVNVMAVVAMTVANGGDNVSVYIPLFATRSGSTIALMGIVFGIMTAAWLALAYWLTRHRTIGAPVRRYTRLLMPFVYIALGIFILYQAGSLKLLHLFQGP
jgi:cadmium resistance protein CadD (predicted permease)